MAKITFQQVSKQFASDEGVVLAIDGLSLNIEENQFVSLVGPSGCGKTTLLNIVAGFEMPSMGSVQVNDQEIHAPGPDRGVVFQEPGLFPWLSVEENIAFPLRIRNAPKPDIDATVESLLDSIGLTSFRKRIPAELSGGMRQRVAIGRVMAMDADVLLMDEPFASLDAQTRIIMQELLTNIWENRKKTVLFITHDLDEAIFLADRVHIMSARPGKIIESLDVELPRPRNANTATTPAFHNLVDRTYQIVRQEALTAMAQMEQIEEIT